MVTLVNRAKVSTSTTGTGTITLGAAESGYQTFADAGVTDGQTVRYTIEDGTAWEIGTGTYTASGTTLSRTVSESSNAGAAINLSGSAVVYVSATAEDIPALELYAENPSSPTAPSATGTNAVAIGTNAISAGTSAVALGKSRAGGANSISAVVDSVSTSYGATNTNTVAIGSTSRATSANSVGIGYLSRGSGGNSVALGVASLASGYQSFAFGDTDATASYAIAIGRGGAAGQESAVAIGTYPNSSTWGKFAYAGGRFSANGDAQTGTFVLRSDTTDATPEALTTNNSTAGTTNQIILPNNSAYAFHGTIVARQQASAGTACAAWKIEGLIRREGSAGTTVLVNSATTVIDNTPGWGMALSADTTNGGLKIEVTGAAATNIRFVATIHTSEVTY